jgi:hypothetical protein
MKPSKMTTTTAKSHFNPKGVIRSWNDKKSIKSDLQAEDAEDDCGPRPDCVTNRKGKNVKSGSRTVASTACAKVRRKVTGQFAS